MRPGEVLKVIKETSEILDQPISLYKTADADPFLRDSYLAQNYPDRLLLQRFLHSMQLEIAPQTTLLYRATRDGFLSSVFHSLCNF
jgi:hypothetical protein